jgi:hypothetical protein
MRTELPKLVEAILQGMVELETQPLEDSLRPLMGEVVRNAHSLLGQRYDMKKGRSPSGVHRPTPHKGSDHTLSKGTARVINASESVLSNAGNWPTMVPPAYQLPPVLGEEEASAASQAFEESQNLYSFPATLQHSDSGYSTQQSDFFCGCFTLTDMLPEASHSESSQRNNSISADIANTHDTDILERSITNESVSIGRRVIKCFVCGGWQFI